MDGATRSAWPGGRGLRDEVDTSRKLEEVGRHVHMSGLGISDDERKMIVKAMGLRSGHWYKCPNGKIE